MPDTYKFTRGATRQQMLDQMQRAQARVVEEVWARRAPGPADRDAGGVRDARLDRGEGDRDAPTSGRASPRSSSTGCARACACNPIRPCSTGSSAAPDRPPDRPIYQSDLDKQTPYNTYQIAGLPPAPIANPGRAALEAVANPSRTNELYFVADGTGGHAFAATLEEHNRNVARWRQIEASAEAGAEAAAPAAAAAPAPTRRRRRPARRQMPRRRRCERR